MSTKYALISGGTGGIGTQLCIQFAERGYVVFALAPEKYLDEAIVLSRRYKNIVPYALDISNVEEIKKAVEFIRRNTNGGHLDVLYNNDGIAYGSPAIEFDDDAVMNVFKINVIGHMYMTKYMSDFIIKSKGTIVFTTSVSARVPLTWISIYGATKAALDQYAWGLKVELQPFGVRVHSVITGGVNTPIATRSKTKVPISSHYEVPGIEQCMAAATAMTEIGTDPEVYAKQVVRQIVKKRNILTIYRGHSARLLNFVARYFPVWLTEYLISSHFKALTVWAAIRKKVKQQDKLKQN